MILKTRVDEIQRVKDNGGNIVGGRLEGRLAISRAFGDFEYKYVNENGKKIKKHVLISEPEVRQLDLDLL